MKNNEILNKLKNTEESVYFTYGDGKKFEGWVLEVRGQSLLVSWKPSPIYAQSHNTDEMNPVDELIDFKDIDTNSLNWLLYPQEETIKKSRISKRLNKWWKLW